MMCSLQVEVLKHENKIVVAYSLVQPITEEEKIHYEDLPLEVVRDQVTEVDHHFFDLNINDPQNTKYVTLGQFKGNLIKWPKKNIELYATSIQSFYRPATHTPESLHHVHHLLLVSVHLKILKMLAIIE
jgi:hypothetical protein